MKTPRLTLLSILLATALMAAACGRDGAASPDDAAGCRGRVISL